MFGKQLKGKFQFKHFIYAKATVLGLVAAIFLTFTPGIGRGSLMHWVFGFWGAAIAIGAYIIGCIIMCFKRLQFFGRICIALGIIFTFCFLSIFSGKIVLGHDIKRAKQFCEELVPLLDAYQEKKGEHPAVLTEILEPNRKLPIILRDDNFYQTCEGDSFSFFFSVPGGMMNGWGYSGKYREWYEWD